MEKGFGCTKLCSYCNWRASPLLPQGAQSHKAVSAFIQQCKKSFITISGGGDPLYRLEENYLNLLTMINTIKAQNFNTRIITRELQHVAKLKGISDHISISLDEDVMQGISAYRNQWHGMDVEFSLVLPPLPAEALVALKPQYAALHKQLRRRLVLRENFNSVFPLDPRLMAFGHKGIVLVPKSVCLNSRYLSTVDCDGHAIVQDNAVLAGYLMNDPDVYLFGGFAKHLMDPIVHLEYGDIDVISRNFNVMAILAEQFAFTFKEVSPPNSYPRYFLGKSVRAGKTVQLVLVKSDEDARKFIFNAQYSVDRFGYNQGFFFDPLIGEANIRHAIHTKTAQLAQGPRSMELFHTDRFSIEQRHRSKLLKKGFMIIQ
jgi:hypothetical protein